MTDTPTNPIGTDPEEEPAEPTGVAVNPGKFEWQEGDLQEVSPETVKRLFGSPGTTSRA